MKPFEITLNGILKRIQQHPMTIADLVATIDISPRGLIAEVNGTLFHSAEFEAVALSNGDVVELIQFMGGGS